MSADGGYIASPAKVRRIRAADLFCGAGGTSTGAMLAVHELGAELDLVAVNHWPTAIETHTLNHPEARHLCADLENVRPREAVPGGVLDILMASPTCTYYSRARGGRPVHDQQRMDPWHVVRWCTELRVHRLLVENVPEMMAWGPCDVRTGRPIERRNGEYFRAWIAALQAIGMRVDYRVICCADYGDATTRERFFLIGRSDRKPLRWPEPTHAQGGAADLLGIRAPWRAAREVIDWSIPGKSIFARKRPLKPNTIRRILAGAQRYEWPVPHVAALKALLEGREPVLDVPAAEAAPLLISFRGTERSQLESGSLTVDEPLRTVSAGGTHHALVMATGATGAARDIGQPVPTITAGGQGGARPHFIQPLLAPYYGSGSGLASQSVCDPVPAITTRSRFGLAQPLIFPVTHNGDARVRSCLDPLPTITGANRGELGVSHAFAEPAVSGYRIDIHYRMLHWRELARAMSFGDYCFCGTATEITRQIGNAVPGRTAKALVRALLED